MTNQCGKGQKKTRLNLRNPILLIMLSLMKSKRKKKVLAIVTMT